VPGRVNGFSLAYTAAGAVVLWSGIKGTSISDTVRALLGGTLPAAGTEPITAPAVAASAAGSGSTAGVTGSAAGGVPAANKALGLLMAGAYGWAGSDEWPYLESGWEEESGWSQYAAYDKSDPYDHAYGIPQANPGTKMASAGSDWKASPVTQIKWGLAYIRDTYGSPSQVPGWTPSGPSAGYVGY
jgi:hypothetical protein